MSPYKALKSLPRGFIVAKLGLILFVTLLFIGTYAGEMTGITAKSWFLAIWVSGIVFGWGYANL